MTERLSNSGAGRRIKAADADKAAAARQRARDRAADDDLPRKCGAPAKPARA